MIETRNKTFLGYFNISSDYWFVGMEEGFNSIHEDLEKRFYAGHNKETLDIQSDMHDVSDQWIMPG